MKTTATEHADMETKCPGIAENLHALLKSNNLNANQLAQLLNIPMMTIRRLLSGETTDPRVSTLKLISNYFGVTIDFLTEKGSIVSNNLKKTRPILVPKLNWETVSSMSSLSEIDLSTWKEWESIFLSEKEKMGTSAFALESRPSMFPRFPQGTIFIFDSEITPKDGDIVLIKFQQNNDLTLRELSIDPPEWQLHPIVPGSSMLHFSVKEHKIAGVNILTMLFNRKNHG